MYVHVCVRACVCVCVCVRACVRVCVRARVHICMYVYCVYRTLLLLDMETLTLVVRKKVQFAAGP